MLYIAPPRERNSSAYELALRRFEEQNFSAFSRAHIPPNCVLLVEYSPSHGEVLCALVRYMLELGYRVDVLLHTQLFLDNALKLGFDDRVRAFATSPVHIEILLGSAQVEAYEFAFFNTLVIYQIPPLSLPHFIPCRQPKNGFCAIDHNATLQYKRILPTQRIFSLLPNTFYPHFLNAHFFGTHSHAKNLEDSTHPTHDECNAHPKSSENPHPTHDEPTRFLIAGRLSKDLSPLLKLFGRLAHTHTAFSLTIVGSYDKSLYDTHNLGDRLRFTGYVSYDTLYAHARQSHFILPLLDASNPHHDRYLYDFSGSLGLSYGFGIIPIIHSKFASHFLLTQENALIYDDDSLFESLRQALDMPKSRIQGKSQALRTLASRLHAQSLEHIAQALQTPCPPIRYTLTSRIRAFLRQRYFRLRRRGKLLYLLCKSFLAQKRS